MDPSCVTANGSDLKLGEGAVNYLREGGHNPSMQAPVISKKLQLHLRFIPSAALKRLGPSVGNDALH